MSKHTSFKTGGPADYYIIAENEQEVIILLHEVLAKLNRLEESISNIIKNDIEEKSRKLEEQLKKVDLNPTIQAAFRKLGPTRLNKPDLNEEFSFSEGFQRKKDSIEKVLDEFEQSMPDILKEREKAYKEANAHEKFK